MTVAVAPMTEVGSARVLQFPVTAKAQRRLERAKFGRTGLKGLRLTLRGRIVVLALSLLVVTLGALFGSGAQASGGVQGEAVATHSVMPGDTLWSIAKAVNPGVDNRDVVQEIEKLNGMESSRIVAGQVLLVPIYEK